MKEPTSPVQSRVQHAARSKTGSEPPLVLDRFIHSRRDHHLRSLAVSFARAAPHARAGHSDPPDYDDYDFAFERSLLSLRPVQNDLPQIALEPLDEEAKSSKASAYPKSTSSVYSLQSSNSTVQRLHRLPKKPFRILDIPGLEDDFYTNVLDWSAHDQIAICLENKVYTHDYVSGATTELFEAFECEAITSLAFSPSGANLAIGNVLGQVLIFDVQKQVQIASHESHSDRIGCMDWKEPGILTGSKDRTVAFTDTRQKVKRPNVVCTHTQEVCGVRLNNQLNLVATGGNDNRVGVWAFGDTKRVMSGRHSSGVKALAWSQRQYGLLVTGGGTNDRTIKVWNTSSGTLEHERNVEAQVCSLLFSKLTNDIISAQGSELNNVRLWRSNGLKPVGVLAGHELRPLHLALSPDGSVLATASPDEKLCFWKVFDEKKFERQEPCLFPNGGGLVGDVNLLR